MYSNCNAARHVLDAVEEAGSDYEQRVPDVFRIPHSINEICEKFDFEASSGLFSRLLTLFFPMRSEDNERAFLRTT